mmetsp:Transcript_43920/g.70444  ORF Transcript_43920/g.70444 Transcript_43920/m.70444 type:complete len:195 (-) Transcript_43920:61-645(-)
MDPLQMSMGTCPMTMYFHFGNDDCVLFKTWKFDTTTRYILTCVALCATCIFREFILYLQKYFEIATLSGKVVPFWPTFKRLEELSTLYAVINPSEQHSAKLIVHKKSNDNYHESVTLQLRCIDAFLYGLSLILGYALMLVVMTFNAGLIIVVVCSYCIGRFLFHRQTQLLQKFAVMGQKSMGIEEDADHCHIRS